ncbi:MAG: hypothetical protein QOE63_2019 [Acidimicrobiaceae bacterium]
MRRRFVLANLVLVVAVLIVLEVPLALVYSRHEHDSLNAGLQRDAAALAALAAEIVEHAADHNVVALAQRYSGETVTIVDAAGNELTPPGVIVGDPAFRAELDAARGGATRSGEVADLSFVAAPIDGSGAHVSVGAVLVARSDESIDDRVRTFWLILVGIGAVALGLSLFVSVRLSRWVVDPLRRLDGRAAALGRGDLTVRAAVAGGPPEVANLALTFNEMAGRLDALVTSQRRFVADASHQLRTPLTALQLRLENLDPGAPDALAGTRDAALDEVSRLSRLVDGLLSLARADGQRAEREPVDVTAVVAERQEAWAPLAAEREVMLRSPTRTMVPMVANLVPGHLDQILDNLIDNALEATPAGGTIDVRAVRANGTIELHVSDSGPGMSDDDRRRAFDPFWTRANGTGLGLAIAEQLARSCNGSLRLEHAPTGGIDAVAQFPVAPPSDDAG